MVEENQITTLKLVEIFQSAFMDVSDITEDRFLVKGVQFPFTMHVNLASERKMISFTDYNPLHRISLSGAAELCNEANKRFTLARFYAYEIKTSLVATCQYEMSFEKGIIPYQLISNFRMFERIAGTAIQDFFKDYLRP